jgi:hypothetical protein
MLLGVKKQPKKSHEESRKEWEALDSKLRTRATGHLLNSLPSGFLGEIQSAMKNAPYTWVKKIEANDMRTGFHQYPGASIRDLLREIIFDHELPTCSWNGLYTCALEDAANKFYPSH